MWYGLGPQHKTSFHSKFFSTGLQWLLTRKTESRAEDQRTPSWHRCAAGNWMLLNDAKWKSHSRVWLFAIPWTVALEVVCSWNSPDKSTGVCCHFLLQGTFPTQGLNLGLLHCRQILYQLSYYKVPYSFPDASFFSTKQNFKPLGEGKQTLMPGFLPAKIYCFCRRNRSNTLLPGLVGV